MDGALRLGLAIFISYFVGSIPTAYVVGKIIRRIDIRQHGSGNVGATNVFRVIGKKWGVAVLIFDMLKGVLATLWVPPQFSSPSTFDPFVTPLVCGMAAIAGHTWTVWLKFKGGKGVATSAGVFLALAPGAGWASLAVWSLIFTWKRYVSLASLVTALLFPFWVICFYREGPRLSVLLPISFVVPLFILFTHRENIRRLREGREKRLF